VYLTKPIGELAEEKALWPWSGVFYGCCYRDFVTDRDRGVDRSAGWI
jgi:hypothetical protein